MREYSKKEIIVKTILIVAIIFLFFDSLFLAVKHIGTKHRINRYLQPDERKEISIPDEKIDPKEEYSKYVDIQTKLLKIGKESYKLQAILGEQAIVLFNNSPITVSVGGKVGETTVIKIEGSVVVLKKVDGTEIKLDMFGG